MQESNIQRYTNASNARRALSKIGAAAREAHKTLIKHDAEINSYYFVTAEAVKVQRDADKLAKHEEKLAASNQLSARNTESASKPVSAPKQQPAEIAPATVDNSEAAANAAGILPTQPIAQPKLSSLAQHIVQSQTAKPATQKQATKKQPAETRNGVRKPMRGLCADVWAALTALHDANHIVPTMADVKRLTEENNWNINNATIEFYGWRKFYDLKK